jgi:FkbM family methyltransferase
VVEGVEVRHAGRVAFFHPDTVGGKFIGTFLRRGEFYEADMLEYIRRLGLKGRYADVGAAVGTHTLFFALVCDAKHVYSFEPRDWVVELVKKNILLNHLEDRVTLFPIGLSDRREAVSVVLDGAESTFNTERLDDVVSDRVVVMKVDVEDMEVQVFNGAAKTLRRSKPLIFAEARNAQFYLAIVACLRGHGYEPTGRYFNSTPTFEFAPRPGLRTISLRWRLRRRASSAYAAIPRQPPNKYPKPPPVPRWFDRPGRVVLHALDKGAPPLARALRRKARTLRSTGRGR